MPYFAVANNDALIEAISADDVPRVNRLLGMGKAELNTPDRHGLTPIFFVSSPQMLMLLLENGARLRASNAEIFMDRFGRNPLHFLFSVTAQNLLTRDLSARQRARLIRRIENTALLFMQHNVIDDISRDHQLSSRLERLSDFSDMLPADYLEGADWHPDFIARVRNTYYAEFRPLGIVEGQEEERAEREMPELEDFERASLALAPSLLAHNIESAAANFFK